MVPELSDAGVPQRAVEIAASYYRAASARMKEWVLKPPGTKDSSRAFRQGWAASKVFQVDQIVRGLKGQTSGWVGANVPRAYRDGIARANSQAVEAGVRVKGSGFSGSFSLIDQRSVLAFARDAAGDFSKAADSMGDRAKELLRQTAQMGLAETEIDRILAGGVIEGQPADAIRTLREELRRVHGDAVEINGRNFEVGYYAELVARTKTRQATVVARHQRLESLGLDLVAIVGLISKHFCTAFLGQVFSLSGKSDKYPAYSSLPGGGPPFHPNCSKSTRPFVEALAEESQVEDAEILPDSAKLLGMTTAKAQRAFTDLQLQAQVKERYATTARKLFGRSAA